MSGKLEKTNTGYYKANQGFATTFEGEPLFVQNGELVHKSHSLLKGREDLFDPAERISRFDRPEIEQATAAPGEKRGNGRRRRKMNTEVEEPPAEEAPEEEAPAEEPAPAEEGGDEEEAAS